MQCKSMFYVASLLAIMATPGVSQSLPQPAGNDSLVTTMSAEHRPYGFAVLGVKPGMPIAQALDLIEDHLGNPLAPIDGTLQITGPDGKAFRTELRLGYETPGIDFFVRNQSQDPFDSIQIDVSTPASGSVVTAIRREVRLSVSDASDASSFLAQLDGLHGVQTETETAPGKHSWLWALDLGYKAIPPVGGIVPEYACPVGMPENGRYSYEPPFLSDGPNNCGATYRVTHRSDGNTVTLTFWLTDHLLVAEDRNAANSQIDQKLNTAAKPSDIKL